MAGGAPKTKASDITDRINAFGVSVKDNGAFDEMSWQRIFREVSDLSNIPEHVNSALLLQAVMWDLKHDRERAKSVLAQAAGKFGKGLQWYLTRANMAPTFGDTSLLTDMLEHSYPRGSKAGLTKVVSMCSQAGMFISAQRALDDLIQIDQKQGLDMEEAYSFVRPASNYLKSHALSEMDVANRVVTASRVVIDQKFRLTKYSVRSDENGLLFEFILDADVDQLVSVNLAIAEAIATGFEGSLWQHLSIGVTPKEEVV